MRSGLANTAKWIDQTSYAAAQYHSAARGAISRLADHDLGLRTAARCLSWRDGAGRLLRYSARLAVWVVVAEVDRAVAMDGLHQQSRGQSQSVAKASSHHPAGGGVGIREQHVPWPLAMGWQETSVERVSGAAQ
jgi:hypothetical protein